MENKNKELEQFFDNQIEEIQKEQAQNIEKSKGKKKGLKAAIIALVLAATTLVIAALWPKKQDKDKVQLPTEPTTSTYLPEEEVSLENLGVKFDNPTLEEEKPQYGEVTGDVNKEEIVEKNETIWKDQEAADKSEKVGKVEIDDKEGTLEVEPNGDVFVKEEGYEIEKEDGTVIEGTITEEDKEKGEIGSNDTVLPPGYVHDENLDKDVIPEHANKYVTCDADYYNAYDGKLVYSKGEPITPEDLELAKQLLTTTKPVIETQPETVPETTIPEVTIPPETVPETTKPEEEFIPTQGIVNADGTYTIDGITFQTKADYEQWIIQGFEGYAIDLDGIMKPESEIIENYNQKTK